jgi:3-oxoadipate enol-lactonase
MLERIRVPVLVLAGEEDTVTPPEEARRLADRIPDGDLRIIPGAGHLSNLEGAPHFNNAIETLLDRAARPVA